MGVRGLSPQGRKFFKKFIENCHVKLKILITFKNIMHFCVDLDTNIRIIENSMRPGVRG